MTDSASASQQPRKLSHQLRPMDGEKWLFVNPATDMVYVRKKFHSERLPALVKKTGFTTKNIQKARRAANDLITAHRIEFLGHDGSDLLNKRKITPFREVIAQVRRRYTPTQRIGTQDNHAYYFGRIDDRFGDYDVHTFTVPNFEDWVDELRVTPTKRKMRNGEVREYPPRKTFADFAKHMNIILNYARTNNLTKNLTEVSNPDTIQRKVLEQKKRQESRTGRKYLSSEEREILELESSRVMTRAEISSLYKTLTGDTKDQFILAFTCIMRLRETLEAPWSEIDLEQGIWTLPPERVKTGSKTGEGRSFYITEEGLEILKRRARENVDGSKFVFPGWSQTNPEIDKPVNSNKVAWRSAKKKANIQSRLRWHDIRHTALTFSILGDPSLTDEQNKKLRRDPTQVAKFAGVSARTIDRVYLHTKVEHTRTVSTSLKADPILHQFYTKICETEGNGVKAQETVGTEGNR